MEIFRINRRARLEQHFRYCEISLLDREVQQGPPVRIAETHRGTFRDQFRNQIASIP